MFHLKRRSIKSTFRHGVHPPSNKHYAMDAPIEVLPPPQLLILPLQQNVGEPCQPFVEAKQKVTANEKIGIGKAFISASLHAPHSGTVQKIGMTTLANGRHLPAIFIKTEGDQLSGIDLWNDVLGGKWPNDCPMVYYADTITKAIHDSGIVGLGGAAFPTHIKIKADEQTMIDTLIINGCECEPYLTPDYRLMVEAPGTIVAGALLAARAVTAKEVVIGIEDNKPEAIRRLRQAAAGTPIQIRVLKTKYPQGSEKQLIKAVLGLEVPLGGLPSDVGAAMSNVGTIAAVARGVIRGKPLTHRVISVTGTGIARPKNLLVPIGTRVKEVIDFCGGLNRDAVRMISGGPMMGFAFSNMETPITKGTSGITVLTQKEIGAGDESACIRCGRCVDACPMNLVPTKLAMASRYGNLSLALQYNIMACFECGCCTFACPSRIKIVQLIRSGKAMIMSKERQESQYS